jgi:hypothetical protein
MKDLFKNLMDSVFVTIVTIIFTSFGYKTWQEYLILFCVVAVVLQFLKLLSPLVDFLNNFKRKYLVKVAILNGAIFKSEKEHKCVRSWIEITPEMWRKAIQPLFPYFEKSWMRSLYSIPVSDINDSWSIIINPFGDNFPEKDQRLHETFYKVCSYISNGGIFIVTGGAFFKHQNPIISNKEELFLTHIINGMQDLETSPLFQEFGVRMTGDIFTTNGQLVSSEPINVLVEQNEKDVERFGDILQGINSLNRFRSTSGGSSNYLPVVRQIGESNYPIAIIPYGKGALIHIGLHITSENSNEFKVVTRMLTRIIQNKIHFLS